MSLPLKSVENYLHTLQDNLKTMIDEQDGSISWKTDSWKRPEGGGGTSCIYEGGEMIERGGVNFSHVFGKHLPPSASAHRPELAGRSFQAMGISVVFHPRNPFAPTSHMNVRLFIAEKPGEAPVWWFGGGFDLTPYYGFEEDCIAWHQAAKAACDPFGSELYPKFKAWCDEYFFITHRNEARGIGGIFFDDFNKLEFTECFALIQSVGNQYLKAYEAILTRRKALPFTEQHKAFQRYRRGRYVEFNLVYDRGTLFGLQSNGRTESILMSLPPEVIWHYNWHPHFDSEEARLYTDFLPKREWAKSKIL